MTKYYLLFIWMFTGVHAVTAQFTDSTQHLISLSSSNSINKADGKSAYLFNNNLRFSVRKESVTLNFNNNWLYGRQNDDLSNNDFSSALDVNLYKTFPNFFYWGLANYNTSYSLRIRNQLLAGAGVAYNFFDNDRAYLNISNGILYDASGITENDLPVDYQTVRNSLRLAFRFEVAGFIVVQGSNFYQPSLRDGQDYNIRFTDNVSFSLYRGLSLTAALTYNRVNRTQRENFLFTYGLAFERYF